MQYWAWNEYLHSISKTQKKANWYNEFVIHTVTGKIVEIGGQFAVIESGGIGYKVHCPIRSLEKLKGAGETKVYTHLQVRDDGMDLFGFETAAELVLFELLISVSGVGPRSALSVMNVAGLRELSAAIKSGKAELLTKAAGVGRKTAERIVVELKEKVKSDASAEEVRAMESDTDLIETLIALGYRRDDARHALAGVDAKIAGLEPRLKAALKSLGGKGKT